MNKQYENIIIPEELSFMTEKTIKRSKNRKKIITSFTSIAAALLIFTTSLNVSSTFAETMQQIPVVKTIASALTFRSYETQTDEIKSEVTIPEVTLDESTLDEYINETISFEVERILGEAQVRAEEYKKAYIETGGTEEGFASKNMTVSVDYEVFTQNDDYLSFRVFTHETLAAVYAENLYFTIDLQDRTLLTLEDLLGDEYVRKMTTVVSETIKEEAESSPEKYFEDSLSDTFTVRDDIDFYLKNGKLYIVFMKYELAPGAYGRLEFEIPMN